MTKRKQSVLFEWSSKPSSALDQEMRPIPTTAEEIITASVLASRGNRGALRDAVGERTAIAMLETATKSSLAEAKSLETARLETAADSSPSAEEDTAGELAVEAAERALEMLWRSPSEGIASAQKAVEIAEQALKGVRTYRSLSLYGWAQLHFCLSLRDLELRVELEENMVCCMAEASRDVGNRLAFVTSAKEAEAVCLSELRSATALGICEHYPEVVELLEHFISKLTTVPIFGSEVSTTRSAVSYILLANAHTTALDGYEAAVIVTEACLDKHPSAPLPHLMWCLLHARLGSDHDLLAARLNAIVQSVAGDTNLLVDDQRMSIALLNLVALTAVRCVCDEVALSAADLGIGLIGHSHTKVPPDAETLACFLTVKAELFLRKASKIFAAVNDDATATVSLAEARKDGSHLLMLAERHTFKALQLSETCSYAHLINGRRMQLLYDRANSAGVDETTLVASKQLAAYESAIRCNPRLGEAYEGAGLCHQREGQLEEAAELLMTAVSLQAKQPLMPFEWFATIL